eukprot:scaffold2902_cov120-Skeletonema_menzelii.AAC.4
MIYNHSGRTSSTVSPQPMIMSPQLDTTQSLLGKLNMAMVALIGYKLNMAMVALIGYMLNGLPHGYGTLFYLDDVSYQGCWYNGQEHGPETMRWENGSIYDGNFIHGEPHGHGFLSNRTDQESRSVG